MAAPTEGQVTVYNAEGIPVLSDELINIKTNALPTGYSDGEQITYDGSQWIYDSAQSAVDNGGTIIDGWVRQYSGPVHVDWFESLAVGSDWTLPVQAAIDSGEHVLFNRLYSVDAIQFNNSNQTFQGVNGGGLIKESASGVLANITGSGNSFVNVVFSGNNLTLNEALVKQDASITGTIVDFCTFKDILGTTTSSQYGLFLQGTGSSAIVSNCLFTNIQSTSDGVTPTSAFCGGIYIGVASAEYNKFHIYNCRFEDIYTNNIGGDISLSDADGIRYYSSSVNEEGLTVSNCYFEGVQKSGIKISHASGVTISDIIIKGTRTDVPMVSGVRVQGASEEIHINNISMTGNCSRVVNVQGKRFTVDGVKYSPGDWVSEDVRLIEIAHGADGVVDTTDVTLRNLSGDHLKSVISVIDEYSNGQLQFIENLLVENVDISPRSGTFNTDKFCTFKNINGLTINNFNARNDDDWSTDGFEFTDCDNITMDGIRLSAEVLGLSFVDSGAIKTGNNVSLSNSSFYRHNSSTDSTVPFILFPDISGVKISNVKISVPTYDTLTNNQALRIESSNVSIDGLHLETRATGGGTANSTMVLLAGAEEFIVSNVTYDMQNVSTQLDTYTIQLASPATNGIIFGIHSNSRGILTEVGVTDVQFENIHAASAEIQGAFGTDVQGIRYTGTDIQGMISNNWYSMVNNGATGSFTASSGETVTVTDGLITGIV